MKHRKPIECDIIEKKHDKSNSKDGRVVLYRRKIKMAETKPTNLPRIENRDLEHAAHLRFCKNGDGNFSSHPITWNKKRIRTFDSFLTELTNKLKLTGGCVRRVYTPQNGHLITDFEKLQEGGLYVAAGTEAFRSLKYAEIEDTSRIKHHKINNNYYVEPVTHSKLRRSGKIKHMKNEGKIIKIWPNGDDIHEPRTVLLTSWMQKDFDVIKDAINERISLQINGPVAKLYCTDGRRIQFPDEIEHGGHYVACRYQERLRKVDYREHGAKNLTTTPRLDSKLLPPLSRSTNKSSKFSSPDHSNPTSSYASEKSNNTYTSRYRRNKVRKEEDGVFHAKPVAHKRGSSERNKRVDYDKDEGGVFKAKGENRTTNGAREIEDTNDTQVDVPVEQREAEIVNEEESTVKIPSGVELTKLPSEQSSQDDEDETTSSQEIYKPHSFHQYKYPDEKDYDLDYQSSQNKIASQNTDPRYVLQPKKSVTFSPLPEPKSTQKEKVKKRGFFNRKAKAKKVEVAAMDADGSIQDPVLDVSRNAVEHKLSFRKRVLSSKIKRKSKPSQVMPLASAKRYCSIKKLTENVRPSDSVSSTMIQSQSDESVEQSHSIIETNSITEEQDLLNNTPTCVDVQAIDNIPTKMSKDVHQSEDAQLPIHDHPKQSNNAQQISNSKLKPLTVSLDTPNFKQASKIGPLTKSLNPHSSIIADNSISIPNAELSSKFSAPTKSNNSQMFMNATLNEEQTSIEASTISVNSNSLPEEQHIPIQSESYTVTKPVNFCPCCRTHIQSSDLSILDIDATGAFNASGENSAHLSIASDNVDDGSFDKVELVNSALVDSEMDPFVSSDNDGHCSDLSMNETGAFNASDEATACAQFSIVSDNVDDGTFDKEEFVNSALVDSDTDPFVSSDKDGHSSKNGQTSTFNQTGHICIAPLVVSDPVMVDQVTALHKSNEMESSSENFHSTVLDQEKAEYCLKNTEVISSNLADEITSESKIVFDQLSMDQVPLNNHQNPNYSLRFWFNRKRKITSPVSNIPTPTTTPSFLNHFKSTFLGSFKLKKPSDAAASAQPSSKGKKKEEDGNTQNKSNNNRSNNNKRVVPPINRKNQRKVSEKTGKSNNVSNGNRSNPPDSPKQQDDNVSNSQQDAAIKIQSQFRGYQTRKQLTEDGQFANQQNGYVSRSPTPPTQPKTKPTRNHNNVRQNPLKPVTKATRHTPKTTQDKKNDAPPPRNGPKKTEKNTKTSEKKDGRPKSELNEKQVQAATKIQAGYRGYKTRRSLNEKKEANNSRQPSMSEEDAVTKIQASFRGRKVREELKETKNEVLKKASEAEKSYSDKEEVAAVKIQAGFRGYKTRKDLAEKESEDFYTEEEHNAAAKIQSGFRGFKARKDLVSQKASEYETNENRSEKNDDTSEQNNSDENAENQIVDSNKEYSDEHHKAAIKIQSNMRGVLARKEFARRQAQQLYQSTEESAVSNIGQLNS